MNRRHIASIGVIGLAFTIVEGGFGQESVNGITSISLSPLVLASWPVFLLAVSATKIGENKHGIAKASWWRKSVAFIYDFCLLFELLFIPDIFLDIVIKLGRLPPPWSVSESVSANNSFTTIVSLTCFFLLWAGIGLALHPRVRTPGMILCNIDLRVESYTSLPKLAFFGVFAYYDVFIPFFNLFSRGFKVSGTMRDA